MLWLEIKKVVGSLLLKNKVEILILSYVVLEFVYNLKYYNAINVPYIIEAEFLILALTSYNLQYAYQKQYFYPIALYFAYTLGVQIMINQNIVNREDINITDWIVFGACNLCLIYLVFTKIIRIPKEYQ